MITSTYLSSVSSGVTRAQLDRRKLSLEAAARALQLRRRAGMELHLPVSPFDIAQKIAVDVRFQNVPSMEGMYCQMQNRPPLIVLASERPAGRQNFTCGHELGHKEFNHGNRLDELLDTTQSPGEAEFTSSAQNRTHLEEFLADRFASFLLMPRAAVDRALARRGIAPTAAKPFEIYILATYLGVGYRTLVEHLRFTLGHITQVHAEELRSWSTRLPKVRAAIAGENFRHIVVVDDAWEDGPVDLVSGDVILIPKEWRLEGQGFESRGVTGPSATNTGLLWEAIRQGRSELLGNDGRRLPVRVSRRGFAGLARFRHLDDPDEDLG